MEYHRCEIKEIVFPKFKRQRYLYNSKFIIPKYQDFYNFIMSLYPDSTKYNEKLYRFLHNVEEKPICPICNQPVPYRNSPAGYGIYCSMKCMAKSESRKKATKETKIKKYGDPNYNNREQAMATMIERYGADGFSSKIIKERAIKACIDKFGVDNVFKLKEFQDKGRETKLIKYGDPYYYNKEKAKQTCLKRYGETNPMKIKEVKEKHNQTMMKRYGVKYAMQSEELVKRFSKSLIKSHADGKYDMSGRKKEPSKIEKQFLQYLDNQNIKYIFQYRSDKYPFLCDFYIPFYDLYIEIQGTWTHGKHPYCGNNDDLKIVEKWKNKHSKFYDNALYVWCDLDVKKRKVANENNINYLEIFSIKIDECIKKFNEKLKDINKYGEKSK